MAKTETFNWYKREPDKFVRGVRGMRAAVIGAYAVILDLIYADEDSCPNDPHWIGGILGESKRQTRVLINKLISLGKLTEKDGRLYNERASEILEARLELSKNRREAGANGGRSLKAQKAASSKINDLSKADKSRVEKNRTQTESSEVVLPGLELHQQLVTGVTEEFDEFYKLYPRKVAKQAALKAYKTARKKHSAAVILEGLQRYLVEVSDKDKQFIAHPATWLNGGRWGDELAASAPSDTKTMAERASWLTEYAVDGRWVTNSSGNGVWKDYFAVGPPPHDPRTLVTESDLDTVAGARAMRDRMRVSA